MSRLIKNTIIINLSLLSLLIFVKPAYSACGIMDQDNMTVSAACTIDADTAEGIDKNDGTETSTENLAVLTVTDAITINSGVSGTTRLIVGSLSIGTGGSISIGSTNTEIKIGTPIYVTDSDADGWAADFTFYTATASGKRRLALMRSTSTTDCDDSSMSDTNSCCIFYADLDGDGYGDPNNTTSLCDPPAEYISDNTDCYDADPSTTNAELAYPGSTTCSSADRGDGSFDYNCDSAESTCGTAYHSSCIGDAFNYKNCIGNPPCNCSSWKTEYDYNCTGSAACGASGSYCTEQSIKTNCAENCDCGDSYCRCIRSNIVYYCGDLVTGTQSCQ
jgi:hypothetical protein